MQSFCPRRRTSTRARAVHKIDDTKWQGGVAPENVCPKLIAIVQSLVDRSKDAAAHRII